MRIRIALLFPAILIIIICIGLACSGGPNGPTTPGVDLGKEDETTQAAATDATDMYSAGLWQVAIDTKSGAVNITSLRTAEMALNALGLFEAEDPFSIRIDPSTLRVDPQAGYVSVDVMLTNPHHSQGGGFRWFDVRGLVFGPRVLNADGSSPLLRPKDFGNVPFGYTDGSMGVPSNVARYDGDIYDYKYFADGLGPLQDLTEFFREGANYAQRGSFKEGSTDVRHYEIQFNVLGGQFLVFNYAILASYASPTGNPPYTLGDYPIQTANAAEPFNIGVDVKQNTLFYNPITQSGGGSLSLDVEVFDWQNLNNLKVKVESPGVLNTVESDVHSIGSTPKSCVFSFVGLEATPQAEGPLDVTITATDMSVTFGESFFLHLMPSSHPLFDRNAYTVKTIRLAVGDTPRPTIGPVQGDTLVNLNELHTYSIEYHSVQFPDGPFFYAWEIGDDKNPQYDDGDGNGDGTIDIAFSQPGVYNVDCLVTDPGGFTGTSAHSLAVTAVSIPDPVGNVTLTVNREADYSIKRAYNVTLQWDAVDNAEEYAIYCDFHPMDGNFDPSELVGTTFDKEYTLTLDPDAAALFVVKARGTAGMIASESAPSQYAFVDFEQAEVPGSEGSWEGNSVYDNPSLQMQRSGNYAYRLSGKYGWCNILSSTIDYINSYEVFYSDAYPEIPDASTFLFEVPHRVFNYNWLSNSEDGYGMGFLANPNPGVGLGPDNYLYFIVENPISGDAYWPHNDAMTDEFTYANNPDAGYTYSYWWRMSTFDVGMLAGSMYDRVAIGHATDSAPNEGAYLAVDDIAVIIY
jgi:hypothetical protein